MAASSSSPRRCSPRRSRRPRVGAGVAGVGGPAMARTVPDRRSNVLDNCPGPVYYRAAAGGEPCPQGAPRQARRPVPPVAAPHMTPDPLDPFDPTIGRRRFLQVGAAGAFLCTIGGQDVLVSKPGDAAKADAAARK